MTSEVNKYVEDLKTFAKESEMFLVRCEKPDRKRTTVN
jgi:preprotein translocase subunit Sss1